MDQSDIQELQTLRGRLLRGEALDPAAQVRHDALAAALDAEESAENRLWLRTLREELLALDTLEEENRRLRARCDELLSRLLLETAAR